MLEANAVFTVSAVIVATGILLIIATTVADFIKPGRLSPLAQALPGLVLVIVGALVITVSYRSIACTKESSKKEPESLYFYVPLTSEDKLSNDAEYVLRNFGKLVPRGKTVSIILDSTSYEKGNTSRQNDLIAKVSSLLITGGTPKNEIKVSKDTNSKYHGEGVYITLNP
ncbi:hypothetical protein [Geomonas anaerohicana]|uniref:Uncharacterized protein n=1 Tax=Geomonas anaerohicana TaxID=2798583 RepID=A0ABS0YJY3_9BACT|nr:hypothetical protein [Geomonas anaerohicana]MBJ6752678.1 hypothetical protein [Geomonas anaerohicana]